MTPGIDEQERLVLRVYNPRSGTLGVSYVSGPIRSGEREYVEAHRADALAQAIETYLDEAGWRDGNHEDLVEVLARYHYSTPEKGKG